MTTFAQIAELVRNSDIHTAEEALRRVEKPERHELLMGREEASGKTLLHIAAETGNLAVIQWLLALDLPPDTQDHGGRTPAQVAASAGYRDIETLLNTRMAWKRDLKQDALPLNRALDLIQRAHSAVSAIEDAENKEVVLVLGETGEGKSTLINYLNGSGYKFVGIPGFDLHTEYDCGRPEVARVGLSAVESETTFPQVVSIDAASPPLLLADLAGMNGTRESVIELAGTLSTHLLAKLVKSVKAILFVVSMPGLQAVRGGPFRETIKTLARILDLQSQGENPVFPSNVYFAITKLPVGVPLQAVIARNLMPLYQQIETLIRTEGLTEETKDMGRVLNYMLTNNGQNIFIPDITDHGASRERLLRTLSGARPMPGSGLRLLSADRHQERFMRMLTFLCGEYLKKQDLLGTSRRETHPAQEKLIAETQSAIDTWRAEIKAAKEALDGGMTIEQIRKMILAKQARLRDIDAQVLEKRGENARLTARLESDKEIKRELDTSTAVTYGDPYEFHHTQEFDVRPGYQPGFWEGFFGAVIGKKMGRPPELVPKEGDGNHTFENGSSPAPGTIVALERRADAGSFGSEERNGPTFKLPYTYPLGQGTSASVRMQLAKRDIPENKHRIDLCNQRIDQATTRLKALEDEIHRLMRERETVDQEIMDLQERGMDVAAQRESLKHQIEQREVSIREATKQIASHEQVLAIITKNEAQLELELQVNGDIFGTLRTIIAILELPELNPLFREFVKIYDQTQGATVGASASSAGMSAVAAAAASTGVFRHRGRTDEAAASSHSEQRHTFR